MKDRDGWQEPPIPRPLFRSPPRRGAQRAGWVPLFRSPPRRGAQRAGWVLSLLLIATTLIAAPKPVAIVASGNASGGDAKFFRYYVTSRLGVVTQDRGDFLDPAEFGAYSLVVWLRSSPRAFTPDEIKALRQYLESGGQILMTNGGPYVGFGRPFRDVPWIKARTWAYNSKQWDVDVFGPDHPYLQGVSKPDPDWLSTYHGLIDHEGVRLLGADNATTLGYTEVGNGRFIFSSYGPYDARTDAHKAATMQLYRNIVTAANPLTERQQAKAMLAAAAPQKTVVFWHRDWSGSNDRRLLWRPAGPRPEEIIENLAFDMVRGEIDTMFFCVHTTTNTGPVSVTVEPLKAQDALPGGSREESRTDRVSVRVMGRAPLIPPKNPNQFANVDPSKRGPFYLLPPGTAAPTGAPAFDVKPLEPRTVWIQVSSHGLPAGSYESRVRFAFADGETADLPLRVRVAPIRMPSPRIIQLRTWGGGIGNDPRLVREMKRQGCDNGTVAYVDAKLARLRNSDVSLLAALRNPEAHLRGEDRSPRIDFGDCWNEHLGRYTQRGLTHITYKDMRTGAWWANAVTGEKGSVDTPFDQWSPAWRNALIDYYTQVQAYFHERGFGMVFPIWTDEPSMETILTRYLPLAKAYVDAGMGPGSHWTTHGWMSPDDANIFIPWTRNLSMYQYGFPNLQRFLAKGSVVLKPGTIVGFTRGGTGLAVRAPHVSSRLGPWSIIHQGQPAHFWRTGPIWKGWLYYVDFTANAWFRLGGVQGERLLAYGSSDTEDVSVDMLTSSDWEGAREGVDDANLARMVEWYLPRMKARAAGAWKARLEAIEAERSRWFTADSPFPIHTRPKHYRLDVEGGKTLDYRLNMVKAESTRDLVAAKRTMIGLLEEMRAHADPSDIQVRWHDAVLVRNGKPSATILTAPGSQDHILAAARSIVAHIRKATGITLPISDWGAALEPTRGDTGSVPSSPKVFVGKAGNKTVTELLRKYEWQLDSAYPGEGEYRILRDRDAGLIAILGVDTEGTEKGVENWKAFVFPEGHWLLSEN